MVRVPFPLQLEVRWGWEWAEQPVVVWSIAPQHLPYPGEPTAVPVAVHLDAEVWSLSLQSGVLAEVMVSFPPELVGWVG